jgi:hypothetical protein
MGDLVVEERRLDRRRFILASAGTVAAAGLGRTLAWPDTAGATQTPAPPPEPIPGGLPVGLPPPYDLIHIFLPGPTTVTLPFSGLSLMGLDVEPSTITDFSGATAAAFIAGSATGSDGVEYGLEVDVRAYEGEYVAADGSVNRGTFALI